MNFKPETIKALENAFSVNPEDKMLVVTDPKNKTEIVWKPQYRSLARGQYNVKEVTRKEFLEHTKEVEVFIDPADVGGDSTAQATIRDNKVVEVTEVETSKEEAQSSVQTEPVKEEEKPTEVVEAPKEEAQPSQAKSTKKTTKKDV